MAPKPVHLGEGDTEVLGLAAEEYAAELAAGAGAHRVVPAQAGCALAAAHEAGTDDAVAGLEAGYPRAYGVDGAHALMAHGQTLRQQATSVYACQKLVGVLVEEVHVGAADGGHGHLDDDLAFGGLGDRNVQHLHLAEGGLDAGLHV
jgi:hypothetical protein